MTMVDMPMVPTRPVTAGAPARDTWIDRLRVGLTVLVVVHHAAITYGASGDWFYRATTRTDVALTLLAAINQAFFMGAFFLLSGLLAPRSLERKGATGFLVDRALRLGVPVLVFGWVLGPLTVALARAPADAVASDWLTRLARLDFVLGPLWFPAALLVFSAALTLRRVRHDPDAPVPTFGLWLACALATGFAALAVRQAFPVGTTVLGFQLGYFVSYAVLFAIGVRCAETGWLDRLDRRQVSAAVATGLLAVPILPVALLTDPDPRFETGFSPAAIIYALWEPLIALGAIAGLVAAARARGSAAARLWSAAAANSYGAFILHAPLLVVASRSLEAAGVPHAFAFPASAAATVVAAFGFTALLRRSAAVRRIL
jgi:fucose 4-O-acetylase-like acetyltransferase